MKEQCELHQLLILSNDFEDYRQIIDQAELPGLFIHAVDDPGEALFFRFKCDLLFGKPSLVCNVINHLPMLIWCQRTWAGVEPLLAPRMRHDYQLTNARNDY